MIIEEIEKLDTEQVNPNTVKISKVGTLGIVEMINNEDMQVAQKVIKAKYQIANAIDLCYEALKNDMRARVFYVGAGTSGRIGILDASEIYPTFGISGRFIGLIAGGVNAIRIPQEGSEDNVDQAVLDLKKFRLSKRDVVIGISASGRTPYVVSALKYARRVGSKTIFIYNSHKPENKNLVDVAIEVITGAEAITGSTRMKAGTSQKMICNMISSGTMIKLGFVEDNYMINLVPSNKKLEQRCINMIQKITNAPLDKIIEVFNLTKNVKLSLLMIKNGYTYEKALEVYREEFYE